jgi:hypothetical protein
MSFPLFNGLVLSIGNSLLLLKLERANDRAEFFLLSLQEGGCLYRGRGLQSPRTANFRLRWFAAR